MRAISAIDDDTLIAALQASGGSIAAAARAVGLSRRAVQHRMPGLARKGYSPKHDMTHPAPDGFHAKGVSTYYDREGKPTGQWVKTSIDHERQAELMQAFIAGLREEVTGLSRVVKRPKLRLENSLSAYPIGDAHIGMYSWAEETGQDFDANIASRDLRAAIDLLVDDAPASAVGCLVDVGDFTHADNRSNTTPKSGHILDVDSRFARVRRIARDLYVYAIDRMLEKHDTVELYAAPGNHNKDSAGWQAMVLEAYYRNNPRVVVETSPSKFFYRRHGRVLLGITHGDKVKRADLPAIMACDRAKDWGETEFRYWLTGHIHHTRNEEYRGCFVESFNTLATSDAWHHESGYRSAQQIQRIDYDKDDGIYGRRIAGIRRVRRALEAA
jgi:hypothetical protein